MRYLTTGEVLELHSSTHPRVILGVAAGKMSRETLTEWIREHMVKL